MPEPLVTILETPHYICDVCLDNTEKEVEAEVEIRVSRFERFLLCKFHRAQLKEEL